MRDGSMRHYRIRGVLGKGGFGTVYRATMEGMDGFRKEVALKVLHSGQMPDDMLARFRDEARILGLVRDRAVVAVDPPTMLDGNVTLVMEFVDGESGSRLVKRHGHLPVRVTAEIIEEIARALDSVYQQPGPTGEPLKLLHRDIKPANLQLTPQGIVKILDFGIAKAAFDERESATTQNVMGTLKYMAPERVEHIEGPFGDVYSLGCVFRRFLLGDRPRGMGRWRISDAVARDEHINGAVAFIDRMTDLDHELRPSIAEVEEFCGALAQRAGGATFRQWAKQNVQYVPTTDDDFSGRVLTEERLGGRLSATPSGAVDTRTPSGSVLPYFMPSVGARGLPEALDDDDDDDTMPGYIDQNATVAFNPNYTVELEDEDREHTRMAEMKRQASAPSLNVRSVVPIPPTVAEAPADEPTRGPVGQAFDSLFGRRSLLVLILLVALGLGELIAIERVAGRLRVAESSAMVHKRDLYRTLEQEQGVVEELVALGGDRDLLRARYFAFVDADADGAGKLDAALAFITTIRGSMGMSAKLDNDAKTPTTTRSLLTRGRISKIVEAEDAFVSSQAAWTALADERRAGMAIDWGLATSPR